MMGAARLSNQRARVASDGVGRLLAWLTAPLGTTLDSRQRRSRMLAWMLLWILALMGAGLVLMFVLNPSDAVRRNEYLGLILLLGVICTISYLANAAGHFRIAAWLFLIPAMAQPWISLAVDPAILRGDYMPLMYSIVPIMVSAFLFSPALTLFVSAFEISGLIVVAAVHPLSFNWPCSITLVVVAAALCLLASGITRRDLLEIDSQARHLAENEALLRELATHDSLTGLHNRRFLESNLAREIDRAERAEETIGLIALDADNLKQVNDRSGHACGDAVLRELGRIVSGHARRSDLACRTGGDEFVLVLPGASRETTLERAELLRRSIQDVGFEHIPDAAGEIVTASLGVAMYPADATEWRRLLAVADEALYRAKAAGRNRVATTT